MELQGGEARGYRCIESYRQHSGPDTITTSQLFEYYKKSSLDGGLAVYSAAKRRSVAQKASADLVRKLSLPRSSNESDVHTSDWSCEIQQQVPFVWEEKPGKPKQAARKSQSLIEREIESASWVSCKDGVTKDLIVETENILPLKLPPRLQSRLGSERSFSFNSSDCGSLDIFTESSKSSIEDDQPGKPQCGWQHRIISSMKISPSDDTLIDPKKDAPHKKIRGSKSGPLIGAFVKPTQKFFSMNLTRAEVFKSRNGLEKLLLEFCPSPKEHNCLQKRRKDQSIKNYTNSIEQSRNYVLHLHTDLSKANEPSLGGINHDKKRSDLMRKNVSVKLGSIINVSNQLKAERGARFPLGELKYYRPKIQKQKAPQPMQRKVSFTGKYRSMMCGDASTVIAAAFSKPVNPLCR